MLSNQMLWPSRPSRWTLLATAVLPASPRREGSARGTRLFERAAGPGRAGERSPGGSCPMGRGRGSPQRSRDGSQENHMGSKKGLRIALATAPLLVALLGAPAASHAAAKHVWC